MTTITGHDDISIMPGGGIARRPLHVIILADCSGSMAGENMQALNFAIASMLPHLADWELEQERAEVLVRVLGFATIPFWHLPRPTPVEGIRWRQPLSAVPRGRTNLGPALQLTAEALRPPNFERRALRPAILLITDGRPTDRPGQLQAGLDALDAVPAGRSALRLAVAIGRAANSEELERFIGDPSVPVLVAADTDEITELLVAASIAVTRLSEAGTDRGELVHRLVRPEPPVAPQPVAGETIL
jgi:uncharacterized protein YegL